MYADSVNYVKLTGKIAAVRVTQFGAGHKAARLSLCTTRAYKNADDEVSIESSWHTVVVWQSKKISGKLIDTLKQDSIVEIEGRLLYNRFIDRSGNSRIAVEISAVSVNMMPDCDELLPEI